GCSRHHKTNVRPSPVDVVLSRIEFIAPLSKLAVADEGVAYKGAFKVSQVGVKGDIERKEVSNSGEIIGGTLDRENCIEHPGLIHLGSRSRRVCVADLEVHEVHEARRRYNGVCILCLRLINLDNDGVPVYSSFGFELFTRAVDGNAFSKHNRL